MKLFLVALLICPVLSLNPIVIKGSKFFDSVTKEQFFIKGISYQPRSQGLGDPLANPSACLRDAPLMAQLGTNVIRVYEVDTQANHDECMKIFGNAGIYLLLDIATPHFSVNRAAPEYDVPLLNAYKRTVDAFSKYTNLLGFIAGNEVSNDQTSTQASAYVKASLRDIKKYIHNTKKRHIPVGYASNDDNNIRDPIKDYFNCGEEMEQADFYGLNLYEWCGESTFESSGYSRRTEEMENYSIPVFLSEYGCNTVMPRPFTEVRAIYGSAMMSTWSGGIVYEWTQENNKYGLVQLSGSNEVELLDDFHILKAQMDAIDPQGVHMDDYKSHKKASACPPLSYNWRASSKLPPTPSEGACACMVDTLECVTSTQDRIALGSELNAQCQKMSCLDIGGNPERGEYGTFSYCSPKDKLSWLYHVKNACHDEGISKLVVSPKQSDVSMCLAIPPNLDSVFSDTVGDDDVSNTTTTITTTTKATITKATTETKSDAAASVTSGASSIGYAFILFHLSLIIVLDLFYFLI